jgi:hypothetical protein
MWRTIDRRNGGHNFIPFPGNFISPTGNKFGAGWPNQSKQFAKSGIRTIQQKGWTFVRFKTIWMELIYASSDPIWHWSILWRAWLGPAFSLCQLFFAKPAFGPHFAWFSFSVFWTHWQWPHWSNVRNIWGMKKAVGEKMEMAKSKWLWANQWAMEKWWRQHWLAVLGGQGHGRDRQSFDYFSQLNEY